MRRKARDRREEVTMTYAEKGKDRREEVTMTYAEKGKDRREEVTMTYAEKGKEQERRSDHDVCGERQRQGEKKKQRFDTAMLQNPETKQQFTIALKNSFCILQEATEMTIHSFNMAMELAGKAVLG